MFVAQKQREERAASRSQRAGLAAAYECVRGCVSLLSCGVCDLRAGTAPSEIHGPQIFLQAVHTPQAVGFLMHYT